MNLFARLATAALLIGASAMPAQAAWHEAKSKHFIIYSDENPRALLEYATKLERFDQAARAILKMEDPPVGDGNRLTVFVLPTDKDVRKLAGDTTGFLKGFYTGRASGPLAYVPKRSGGGPSDLGSDSIFYHEYAHHLMMQQLNHPYPEWYVEGFAEFLSTPQFHKNGTVGLGAPPQHRAWGLFNGRSLSLETLLGGSYSVASISKEQRESIYGRGWLLVHYLSMSGERSGQLNAYLSATGKGTAPLDAARSVFGDLKLLEKDLNAYLNRRTVMTYNIAPRGPLGAIEVKPLSPGGARVILARSKLKKGLSGDEQTALAAELRQIQASFPGDELVELSLAEAELDAGRHTAAEAAADRALKANPKSTEAMVLKGRATLERAGQTTVDSTKLIRAARDMFIAANKVDPEDPEPLMEFYKSFLIAGQRPNANAIEALHYASNLAPQDLGLRLNSAIAYLNQGKLKEARLTLVPVAYSPHGGGIAAEAKRMIARIDAGDAKGALRRSRSDGAAEASN